MTKFADSRDARVSPLPPRDALAAAIDSANVCVAVFGGRDIRFQLVNPAYQRLAAEAPMIGRRLRDVFSEAAELGAEAQLLRVLETGERWRFERFVAPVPADPEALWEGEAVRVVSPDGEPCVVAFARNVAARVKQERQLEAAHERRARILESITDGLAVLDRDWRYTYLSETGAEMLGVKREDLVGRCIWDVFPRAREWKLAEVFLRVVETGHPERFEEYYPEPIDKWLESQCYPSADGLSVYFRDVTSRRRAENALRESRERLDAALAGSGAGTFRWNIQTDALDWDENLDRLFGLPSGQTVRSLAKFVETVHPDDRAGVIASCRRCAAEGADFEMEFRVVYPDGAVHWLYDKGKTFRDETGRPSYMTGVCLDITERKRIDEARRASDELAKQVIDRYRALIEATGDIVWTNTADGEMRGPQPAWCAYTGLTEAEVQGYGWSRAIHPADVEPTIAIWKHAVATRTTFVTEHRARGADGVYRWFAARAVPVVDSSGAIREWVGLHRNIDARKKDELRLREALADVERARQEAERANHSKDDFLAMLGHELRNPLSPISTALHLLKLRGAPEREVRVIERQTQHLTRLVDDLLDVARITGGKATLTREPIELSEIVAAAIETASPLIESGQHALAVEVPARGLVVDADRVRLAQVLGNLLTNAAKYTPPGGRIRIAARRDGDAVVIDIEDSGAGIAADLLPRVFDLFVQARQTLARSQGGLGIGLAIVKSLVTMHGGSVAARSGGVGRGSTFTVTLPALDAVTSTRTDARPTTAPPSARHRVLVVDDNVDSAEMLSEALEAFGYRTAIAHDGPAALRVAEDFRPDVALLDIGLPVMDGYELAERLRAKNRDVKLVAITGYGQESDRRRTREAGFHGHLTKPVDFEALGRVLEASDDGARGARPSRPES